MRSILHRVWPCAGICLLFMCRLSMAVDPAELPDPALQSRYLQLTHEIRCVVCQGESIADSGAKIAGDLRRQVRELLVAGRSDEDVRNYMVARYGEYILYRPRFSPRTAWLWLTPGILLIIGAVIAVRVVRQRSHLLSQDTESVEEEDILSS